jgi:hypothetical protein
VWVAVGGGAAGKGMRTYAPPHRELRFAYAELGERDKARTAFERYFEPERHLPGHAHPGSLELVEVHAGWNHRPIVCPCIPSRFVLPRTDDAVMGACHEPASSVVDAQTYPASACVGEGDSRACGEGIRSAYRKLGHGVRAILLGSADGSLLMKVDSRVAVNGALGVGELELHAARAFGDQVSNPVGDINQPRSSCASHPLAGRVHRAISK